MNFREWLLQNEARFKGFKRQFVASNPDMPSYVASDLYNNRVGYTMRKHLGASGLAPTLAFQIGGTAKSPSPASSLANDILQAHDFRSTKWTPKAQIVQVHPLDFDDYTLSIFLHRHFGFQPSQQIRQDAERNEKQRQILIAREPGRNEPIILVKKGDKYQVLEGWHRTMAALVFMPNPVQGAPPDQIALLKKGDITRLDFTRWKPVRLRAYIGQPN